MALKETIGIGATLGGFEIEKVLGKGGMGTVYKAHESSLNRKVALKVLSHMLSADTEFITRFKKEAQIIAALNHPNIVSILSFGQDLDHYYFAMEYIKGRDLAQILKEKKIIPLEEALTIARQVADALSEAGKKGVVHRDLKPANIMIDAMNQIRVTDFGVARIESANDNLTKTGMFLGSPQYASPEQAEGLPIDTRSDIYALGAVLYRMLAGTPPTVADSPLAVVVKIVSEPVTPIEEVNKTVPKPVCALIGKMMAKDKKQRYQNPDEVIAAIDNCLHLLKTSETREHEKTIIQPPPPLPAQSATEKEKLYNPWIAGTISVLTLILLLWGGSFLLSKISAKSPVDPEKPIISTTPTLAEVTTQHPVETPTPPKASALNIPAQAAKVAPANSEEKIPTKPQESEEIPAANIYEQEETDLPAMPPAKPVMKNSLISRVPPATSPQAEPGINHTSNIQAEPPPENKNIELPEIPTILLIVTGPDEMTLPLQTHLESTLLDDSLQVISPAEIPILSKKMQIGNLPINWYNIRQFTPQERAHILVLAKIQQAGSTTLRFYGTSQEQITAVFSVKTMDMATGKLVDRSITGTIRYTALNMEDEFKDALTASVDIIANNILEYWRKKKEEKSNITPASPIKTEPETKLKI